MKIFTQIIVAMITGMVSIIGVVFIIGIIYTVMDDTKNLWMSR